MNPIFCAIDTPDLAVAEKLVDALKPHIGGIKLGLEFFLAHGNDGYRKIAAKGAPIFLDLKIHDIPNTVAGAIKSILPLQPAFLTIHTSGGPAMMRAAAEAAAGKIKLLGVTVLTSLDAADLTAVGQGRNTTQQAIRLARLAKENGLDGVICSPEEISSIRAELGADFILMVPGIRPAWTDANDQKRVMTPRQAQSAGANYLVIGRPITQSDNPAVAAQRIISELA